MSCSPMPSRARASTISRTDWGSTAGAEARGAKCRRNPLEARWRVNRGLADRMSDSEFDPEYVFKHHPVTPEKVIRFDAIHAAAKQFAEVILANTPEGAAQRPSLRRLREAAMIANAAVALDGRMR